MSHATFQKLSGWSQQNITRGYDIVASLACWLLFSALLLLGDL